jgi:hydroxyethylthiazole kinase-like uncharacterized protein yjeF
LYNRFLEFAIVSGKLPFEKGLCMDRLMANLTVLDQRAVAQAGIPTATLMENAGQALAQAVFWKNFAPGTPGVILCGPGNNGGDGFVVARLLLAAGFEGLTVVYTSTSYRGEALENLEYLLTRPIAVINAKTQTAAALAVLDEAGFVIDALFGSGLSRPIIGLEASLLKCLQQRRENNSLSIPWVLAADIPSGVDAATGQVLGIAVEADETVVFALGKPGLYLQPGKSLAGQLTLADIGLPEILLLEDDTDCCLMSLAQARRWLAPRPAWGHKNTFGHVVVVAGSKSMPGAAVLCSEAAMSAGCGLVTLGAPQSVFSQIALMPEIMRYEAADTSHWTPQGLDAVLEAFVLKNSHAIALGPGLGRAPETLDAVHEALQQLKENPKAPPVVLDADVLFALAQCKILLNERFVITPHVGECAHLLDMRTDEISADLLSAARLLRERFQCQVVLKSATTVVALLGDSLPFSEGCWISPWGNSGMATAGSGDVLTGIIAAQAAQAFAQGLPLHWAVTLGVALHGLAGDAAAAQQTEYACHASDIRRSFPKAFYRLLEAI